MAATLVFGAAGDPALRLVAPGVPVSVGSRFRLELDVELVAGSFEAALDVLDGVLDGLGDASGRVRVSELPVSLSGCPPASA